VIAIGFDLDLTLADTREGIAAAMRALSEKTGVPIDAAAVVSRLGPPLETELANWFPAEDVADAAVIYRGFYNEIAVRATVPMRGAEATIRELGLDVDEVVGSLFADAKGTALLRHGVAAYVGDHVADVDAARAASARSVAVATGPYDAEALLAYGADIVLPDLRVFPETLTELINAGPASRQ